MSTAHATNITPGTIIRHDNKTMIVRRVNVTTNHIIFADRHGETIVVNKLEEIEVVNIDHV